MRRMVRGTAMAERSAAIAIVAMTSSSVNAARAPERARERTDGRSGKGD